MGTVLAVGAAVIAVGLLVGAVVARTLAARHDAALASMRERAGQDRDLAIDAAVDRVLAAAGERLSAQASLQAQRGAADLDGKKNLIDAQLDRMGAELGQVVTLVRELERGRASQFGELTGQLRQAQAQTAQLAEATTNLREALASSRARGQWGERMADDVLRLAGLVEGVSYVKQRAIPGGTIPDVTFLMPGDLVLHMDCKFPLDNYLRHLDAGSPEEADRCRSAFLRDVRDRVKEVTTRGYVDPAHGTLDCVLLFIPNEQLYAFIQQHDPALLDSALRRGVVCCSPMTLFAVLAVMRQAVDSFALERRSHQLLSLLGSFESQWGRFVEQMDRVGRELDRATRAFADLEGTRRRQLERPLAALEQLRRDREEATDAEPGSPGPDTSEAGPNRVLRIATAEER